jgi:hypothetical protein
LAPRALRQPHRWLERIRLRVLSLLGCGGGTRLDARDAAKKGGEAAQRTAASAAAVSHLW